jgi:restriction system protein
MYRDFGWMLAEAILNGVLANWLLFAILGLIILVALAARVHQERRLSRSGIYDIDRMDGETFEKRLEILFRQLGFKVERTPYRGDYGADLVLVKDGVKTVVQAKRYKKNVGVAAVQQAVAAKGKYDCSAAMVVTNSSYTQQAQTLAAANNVELWDRLRLIKTLLSVQPQSDASPPIQELVVSPESLLASPAVCARCGKTVSEKVRQYCLAHQGHYGGQVYCYEHQRRVSSPTRS